MTAVSNTNVERFGKRKKRVPCRKVVGENIRSWVQKASCTIKWNGTS